MCRVGDLVVMKPEFSEWRGDYFRGVYLVVGVGEGEIDDCLILFPTPWDGWPLFVDDVNVVSRFGAR